MLHAPHLLRDAAMTHPLYAVSIPVFRQMLTALDAVLVKAEAHAAARNIDPDALLQARLFPDMFTFTRQVQLACDFAKAAAARLSGIDVPARADVEKTFPDLRARIAWTLEFLGSVDPAAFAGTEQRPIVLRPGAPTERRFSGGDAYLTQYGLAQFFFHVTTAYDLLRHNGVEIGKKDYLGS